MRDTKEKLRQHLMDLSHQYMTTDLRLEYSPGRLIEILSDDRREQQGWNVPLPQPTTEQAAWLALDLPWWQSAQKPPFPHSFATLHYARETGIARALHDLRSRLPGGGKPAVTLTPEALQRAFQMQIVP